MHRVRGASLVVLLAAVGLAGCTASGGSFVVEAPQWRAGYTWAFDQQYKSEWSSTENGITDNDTYEDTSHSVLTVLNTTFQQDGTPYYIAMESRDGWEHLMAYRVRDLAPVWTDYDQDRMCRDGACTSIVTGLHVDDAETPTFLDFPLRAGKTWGEVIEEGDDDMHIEFLLSSKVLGREVVETGAGAVQAIHVRHVVTIQNLDELKAEFVRMLEEEEGITVDVFQLTLDVRMDTYYSEDHRIPVQTTQRDHGSLLLRGRDGGEPFEWQQRWQDEYSENLAGAQLVAQPEVPIEQAGRYIAGEVNVEDPTGTAGAAVSYSIAIHADKDRVLEGQALAFSAQIEGDMPDGHEIRWRLLDWRGVVAAESTGPDFRPTPNVAGSYRVVAQAGANSVAAAAVALAAVDLDAVYDVACGPAEVAGTTLAGDCDTLLLPIFPGVGDVAIRVTSSSSAEGLNRGAIHLIDPAGDRIVADGDGRTLIVDDFSDHWLGDELWRFDYVRQIGIAEELQVSVQVHYDFLGGAVPTMPSEPAPGWQLGALALPTRLQMFL